MNPGHLDLACVIAQSRMGFRRGWLLLECLLSLALFLAAAVVVFEAVGRSSDSVHLTRRVMQAADLARSAMSRIEAGDALPETLSGPVEMGTDSAAAGEHWELEVQTEAAGPTGLMRVSVRAILRPYEGSERELASFTLVQAIRIGGTTEVAP
jgi:hypothetical protein